jgi:hypothetical protein
MSIGCVYKEGEDLCGSQQGPNRTAILSKHSSSTMADQLERPQFDRTIDFADIYMERKAPDGLVSTAFAGTSNTLKALKVTISSLKLRIPRLPAPSDLYFLGCSHYQAFRCGSLRTQHDCQSLSLYDRYSDVNCCIASRGLDTAHGN